jgi:hypothetical protein
MSADELRRAASLMRERAEAATQPEWAEWHMLDDGRAEVFVPNGTMDTETVFEFKDHMDCEECIRPTEADLLHIASWHPAVALAVADWLEVTASDVGTSSLAFHAALAVARAYLGADA